MKKLHATQEKLLELLQQNRPEPLTLRELQDELGLSSHTLVLHHINQLEKRGLLRRNPSNPNDYQVLVGNPEDAVTYVNLYGLAQCGPSGSILDGNPIVRLPLSSRIFGFSASDAFLVKARGDSMTPKINHGDFVVAQKNRAAQDRDIIVCTYNEMAMIKILRKSQGMIFLESLNDKYPPILVAEGDLHIDGIVKGVYSSF